MPLSLSDLTSPERALRCLRRHCPALAEESCWPFQGPGDKDGYGRIGVMVHGRTRNMSAHRLAYLLHNGTLPAAPLVIRHLCDHPPCCNPAHLAAGTVKDNSADAIRQGRQAHGERHGRRLHPERYPSGDQHPARLHPERLSRGERHYLWKDPEVGARLNAALDASGHRPRGERHGNAVLTEDVAMTIIARLASGESQSGIARDLGIGQPTISDIAVAKTWTHLLRPPHMAQPPYQKKRR